MIKTDLSHLPEGKQRTLAEIRRVVLNEVERYAERKKSDEYVVWLVLFGSHARGDFVVNPINGYISDFDILVAVHGRELADDLKLWYRIEDKIDRLTRTPINLIVHTHSEVSHWLNEGHYFFSDIRKDGIYLYTNTPNKGLLPPKHLTNAERLPIAQKHYEEWFASACEFIVAFNAMNENNFLKNAAFQLHQATERFYGCILLVLSNYRPPSHNIKNLRHMCIDRTLPDSPFTEIFPGNDRFQRRCFERLKRAYIESRYSEHYVIDKEELEWLADEVETLKQATKEVCEAYIEALDSSNE